MSQNVAFCVSSAAIFAGLPGIREPFDADFDLKLPEQTSQNRTFRANARARRFPTMTVATEPVATDPIARMDSEIEAAE